MRRHILIALGLVTIVFLFSQADFAQAEEEGHTHFRFGHITWETMGPNTAELTFTAAFRRNGYVCRAAPSTTVVPCGEPDGRPGVGDFFLETIGGTRLNFGDGTSPTPTLFFRVLAFSVSDNWVLARALSPGTTDEAIPHPYPGPGPFTAFSASCCRISALATPNAHINNPDGFYRVEAIVNFAGNSGNPKSLVPPIVDCPQNTTCRFTVAAIDPNNEHSIHWRFSDSSEAGLGFAQPPGAIIDGGNGLYTWDTTGASLGPDGFDTLYSTQVTIEDVDPQGNGISKSAIDFFIRLVPLEAAVESIKIPIRWCAVEGSPSGVDGILLQRLDLVNSNIFTPQANIQFRSGAIETGLTSFPTIRDPCRPESPCPIRGNAAEGVGALGDIVFDGSNRDTNEFKEVLNKCREAWQESAPQVTGIIAVQINRFVDANGNPSDTAGLASRPTFSSTPSQLHGSVGVQDFLIDNSFFNRVKVLGQELAHALSLHHGDGINQDNDGDLDEDPPDDENGDGCPGICNRDDDEDGSVDEGSANDDDEDGSVDEDGPGTDADHNLMGRDNGFLHFPFFPHHFNQYRRNAVELTELQQVRIRDQAILHIPDRGINPVLPPLGNAKADPLMDAGAGNEFVDIDLVVVTVDQLAGKMTFALSTLGELPDNISDLSYIFLADLDNSPSTGGSPADIGIATTFQGAEFVGQVHLDLANGLVQARPSVKKFDTGTAQFVDVIDPRIEAKVLPKTISLIQNPGAPAPPSEEVQIGQIIAIELPSVLVGPVSQLFRLEAIAKNPSTGAFDSAEVEITFEVPVFPTCQVNPTAAIRGTTLLVEASGLPPLGTANLLLSSREVATGLIDDSGNVTIDFEVPEDAPTGLQPIRVVAAGTAITADCAVSLQAVPQFEVPPSPGVGAVLTVNVGAALTFDIQASDDDVDDEVTLGAIGLPAGALFPIPTPANPVSSTFSWSPSSGQEGDQVVVFTAQDNRGLSAPPHAVIIRVVSVVEVAIDIKPGSEPNALNPKNRGLIPVAILTTPVFDATTVDPLSVEFGSSGAHEAHNRGHIQDMDGDGDLDLVLHFRTQETGIQCGDSSTSLTGETFAGQPIQGLDSVVTVGCD